MKSPDMGINERFKQLRIVAAGERGKAAFARMIEESHSNVSRYEAGRTIPAHVIAKAAEACGANAEYLLTGEGEMFAESKARRYRDMEIKVVVPGERDYSPDSREVGEFFVLPLLRDPAAAGPGRRVREDDIEGPAIIHRDWCPNPEHTDYVRIQGNSMEPSIPNESIVTIDRAQTNPEQLTGKVVAIYIARTEEVAIKRIQRDDVNPERLVAIPDNMTRENRLHVLEEGDRIIGRVISVHAVVK